MSVIECRNKIAIDSTAGDWTTTLNENILIEQGDVIRVKDSVIDTQAASSNKIFIPNDINISMDLGFMVTNSDQTDFINWDGSSPPNGATHTNFVLSSEYTTGGFSPDFKFLTEYKLETLNNTIPSIQGTLTFTYISMGEITKNIIVDIPSISTPINYEVQELINIIYKDSTGITVSPPLETLNLKISSTTSDDVASDQPIFNPYIRTKTILIEAGNYNPDELTQLINLRININNVFNSPIIVEDDSIMQTSRQIQQRFIDPTTKKPSVNFALTSARREEEFEPYRLASMYEYDGTSGVIKGTPIFLGSSIFELSFSSDSTQFSIKYLHTPGYTANGIDIQYINTGSGDVNEWLIVDRIGGNFISNLYATEVSTGKAFDFWDRMLGLDINDIGTRFTFKKLELTNADSSKTTIFNPVTEQLRSGKSATGGLATLDGVITKTAPRTVPITNFTVSADPSSTNAIIGSTNNILNNQVPFGYYLIEINSQFKNEFLTPENNFRNVSQIVNKYQTFDSFTYGESGQLQYEHKGEPMLLQSFKCRILDSDKNVAPNIGTDSTIHIEIIKGVPELPSPSKTAGKK